MFLIDTHTHLYDEQFDEDRAATVERALAAGVTTLLLPDIDSSTRGAMLAMAAEYPCCRAMVGVHPTSINENPAWREEVDAVAELLQADSSRFCAVGEIGLDLYWSKDFEAEQRETFTRQVELAKEYDLPIAVHCRDAWELLIELLTPLRGGNLRGVIHAFTGSVEHYESLRELGDFLFGIGGVVTFKKSSLAPVVAQMRLEDIVLETDSPYLAPTPHRGKRNESAYVPLIAAAVADLQAVSLEEVGRATTASAQRMFLESNRTKR